MLENLNTVLEYIEQHLTEDIKNHKLELITGVSDYHFRRIFSFLSGISLSNYIRLRRLSKAAIELQQGASITETAFKYGYQSIEGFSRAFKEWFGISPSNVSEAIEFKLFSKMSFQLTIRGGINMNYRIEEKSAFKLVGLSAKIPIQFNWENNKIKEKIIDRFTEEQRQLLKNYRNTQVKEVVNASYNFDEGRYNEKGFLDHLIGSITTLDIDFPEQFTVINVPQNIWAIFKVEGPFPNALQDTWAKIFSEWLPSTDYQLVQAPEISFNYDFSDPKNIKSQIWIAVSKNS
ncbi:AraC family transcriptional regulator [Clostridium sp. Marseille-Q2269]|uniref:AraC family transcriptional regulator n=1 Tax=Clostridium sp. Marseille-Q2269 TaxID=2942205 RepID=UPI002072F12F|nr:AraC family transcriptional regulator [Clostridium sp. Marseille-Q2269]